MGLTELQAKLAQARTALEGGDYASAKLYATSAQAMLAGIPNSGSAELRADFRDRAGEITALLASINRLQHAAAGVRTMKVTYARATD